MDAEFSDPFHLLRGHHKAIYLYQLSGGVTILIPFPAKLGFNSDNLLHQFSRRVNGFDSDYHIKKIILSLKSPGCCFIHRGRVQYPADIFPQSSWLLSSDLPSCSRDWCRCLNIPCSLLIHPDLKYIKFIGFVGLRILLLNYSHEDLND